MIGYHGSKNPAAVLEQGLRIRHNWQDGGCPFGHICLAETPEIAAAMAAPGSPVLVVDLADFDVPPEGFVGGEMRVHVDIPASRISVLPSAVRPSLAGHVDPYYGYPLRNHPTCVRLMAFQRAHRALPAAA